MSQLVDYKRAVEARVREILPAEEYGVRFVATHVGKFGADEVTRYSTSSPAVILAPMGLRTIPTGGTHRAFFDYAAFIIAKSKQTDTRGELALAITEAIVSILPNEGFADGGVPTSSIDAANLYDGKIDGMGLTLWCVKWSAPIMLTPHDISDLDNFLRQVTEFDLGGESDFTAPLQTEITTHPEYTP